MKYLLLLAIGLSFSSYKSNLPLTFDEQEVKSLVAIYFNKLEAFANKQDLSAYDILLKPAGENTIFKDIIIDHDSALNDVEVDTEESLENYIALLFSDFENKIKIEFSNDILDNCIYHNYSIPIVRVEVHMKIHFLEEKRIKHNIYDIAVNVQTPSMYRIEYVKRKGSMVYSKSSCNTLIINNSQTLIALKNKEGKKLLTLKKYIEAKSHFEVVLGLDNRNITANKGIEECNENINLQNSETKIKELIQKEKFSEANKYINKVQKENLIVSSKKISEFKKITEEKLLNNRLSIKLKVADTYFNNGQYNKALQKYRELLKWGEGNKKYLENQIQKCKEGDPYYVQKQLKLAYNQAVKSKKNYLSTFKVYKKYENSNLLTGEQYLFMMLMMLDKPKTVIKPMGYSKNNTKYFSREYFYKAKEKGGNNKFWESLSFYETQVFTKNIEKRYKK